AAGKLQGLLPGSPITYRGQNIFNITLLATVVGTLIYLVFAPAAITLFFVIVGLALLFGFLLVIPIGAADMPVVIALLNSYGGLADASMGFVLMNKIQIITGSLDGTSGFLLSLLMCRAMNRSAMNVLFGAFGKIEKQEVGPAAEAMGTVRSITPEELTVLFDSIRSVIVLVVGANDVTNPAAKNNENSPLYGMPILEVDRAKSIIVLKRSLRPGFAGVDNDLYYNPKCMMLFGDAKESLNKLFAALKS